jgi:hypothetical protein
MSSSSNDTLFPILIFIFACGERDAGMENIQVFVCFKHVSQQELLAEKQDSKTCNVISNWRLRSGTGLRQQEGPGCEILKDYSAGEINESKVAHVILDPNDKRKCLGCRTVIPATFPTMRIRLDYLAPACSGVNPVGRSLQARLSFDKEHVCNSQSTKRDWALTPGTN